MSSVKLHSFTKRGPVATARHQAIAGKDIKLEHTHTRAIRMKAFLLVIFEGYEKGSVITQYLEINTSIRRGHVQNASYEQ